MGLTARVGRLLGRVALAPIFIVAGFEALRDPGHRPEVAAKAGLPSPELLVRLNGAAMVAGGLGLATGLRRRLAALGLIASLGATTVVGHPFWREEPGPGRTMQRVQFLKNLGLLGGLALVVCDPGRDRDA
ncbi:DoxX family protein [Acidimicrobium ferrooxidans DSM 10331]|uniref:DoxX family protein n=1 Tax=Acidimicrobium ferrooxidans (strain DSM 10331 / JCM 15462 / NBRC 103882 / ICP) TaxID=525909 RepID=C7LYK5_ACIFD|nr:DoxX family protein [Acidimicrobium ferrooxidans]ACU53813.1 DoxX family protein [Acidimicrobium ferrooxidans DSM 10331]